MTESGGTGGYPELERRRAMLRLLRRRIAEAHERGELRVRVSVSDVAEMVEEVGGNEAQSVALFQRLYREGCWSGNLGKGYKDGRGGSVPFAFALVEDLTSKGMREIGDLPDPAEDLARRLVEAARAIDERDDVPEEQKTLAKRALGELAHFFRGLPPGVAVEVGSRLMG